jgi:hypothetical protein
VKINLGFLSVLEAVMQFFLTLAFSIGLLSMPLALLAQINLPSATYKPTAKINFPGFDELSGVVPARQPGEFWAHNDDTDTHLYRFNEQGEIKQVVKLKNVENIDWEAMTIDPQGTLYIGEIGNNNEKEQVYSILSFPIPAPDQTIVAAIEVHYFTYADNKPHNCEAMVYFDEVLYLITKERNPEDKPLLFALDLTTRKKELIAEKIGEMQIEGNVTDAAYSARHNQLAVLTYHGLSFFPMHTQADFLQPPQHVIHSVMGWTEAVCYSGTNLLVADEPGFLFIHPLDFWMSHSTYLPPSVPDITLTHHEQKIIVDGDLSDWQQPVIMPMQYEVYSKYQSKPETSHAAPQTRLQWSPAGLYLGFGFANKTVLPDLREHLVLMLHPDTTAIFPKGAVFIVFYKTENNGSETWHISCDAWRENSGCIAAQHTPHQTTVEAFLPNSALQETGFIQGRTFRLNIVKRERHRESRKVILWYWSTRASFVENHPDLWGILHLR